MSELKPHIESGGKGSEQFGPTGVVKTVSTTVDNQKLPLLEVGIKPRVLAPDQVEKIQAKAKGYMERGGLPTKEEADALIAEYKKMGVKLTPLEEAQLRESGLLVRTGAGAAFPSEFDAGDVGDEQHWLRYALAGLESGEEIYYTGGLEGLNETTTQGRVGVSLMEMRAHVTPHEFEELEREYKARIWLHNIFREMGRADNVASVVHYTAEFQSWMFTFLFRLPGVAEAFRQYEIHGHEFITARGEAQVRGIRQNIRTHLENNHNHPDPLDEGIPNHVALPSPDTFGPNPADPIRNESFTSAQAEEIARRLWRVTQREAWYWATQTLGGVDDGGAEYRLGDPRITKYRQRYPRNSFLEHGTQDVSGQDFNPYPSFRRNDVKRAQKLTGDALEMFRALPNWTFKPPDRKLINPHIIPGAFLMGGILGHIVRTSLWHQHFDYQLADVFSRRRGLFQEGIYIQYHQAGVPVPAGFNAFFVKENLIGIFGDKEGPIRYRNRLGLSRERSPHGGDFNRAVVGSIPTMEHVPLEQFDFTFVSRTDPSEGPSEWFRGHWRDQATAEGGLDNPMAGFITTPTPQTYAKIEGVRGYATDSEAIHEKVLRAMFEVHSANIPFDILDFFARSPGKKEKNWAPINQRERMQFIAQVLAYNRIGKDAAKRLEGQLGGRVVGGVDRFFGPYFVDALMNSILGLFGFKR